MRDLAIHQALLWKLITAPEGAQAGIDQLDAAQRAQVASLVRGDARLSAVERLDIYANMYFFRLLECLREDYPVLLQQLGDARFHNLITDYLLAHPPRHFSLRHAGAHLAEFLEGHDVLAIVPHAAALAQFEWFLGEAFDAADAEPIEAAVLASVAEESWPGLRFALAPSLRYFETPWAVLELWEAADRGDVLPQVRHEPTALRIWRHGLRVCYAPASAAESAALQALSSGATFAQVCAAIARLEGDIDAAERAATILAQWFADGLIVGVSDGVDLLARQMRS